MKKNNMQIPLKKFAAFAVTFLIVSIGIIYGSAIIYFNNNTYHNKNFADKIGDMNAEQISQKVSPFLYEFANRKSLDDNYTFSGSINTNNGNVNNPAGLQTGLNIISDVYDTGDKKYHDIRLYFMDNELISGEVLSSKDDILISVPELTDSVLKLNKDSLINTKYKNLNEEDISYLIYKIQSSFFECIPESAIDVDLYGFNASQICAGFNAEEFLSFKDVYINTLFSDDKFNEIIDKVGSSKKIKEAIQNAFPSSEYLSNMDYLFTFKTDVTGRIYSYKVSVRYEEHIESYEFVCNEGKLRFNIKSNYSIKTNTESENSDDTEFYTEEYMLDYKKDQNNAYYGLITYCQNEKASQFQFSDVYLTDDFINGKLNIPFSIDETSYVLQIAISDEFKTGRIAVIEENVDVLQILFSFSENAKPCPDVNFSDKYVYTEQSYSQYIKSLDINKWIDSLDEDIYYEIEPYLSYFELIKN